MFIEYTGSLSMGNIDYEWNLPLHFINLNCTGNEDSIWNCSSSTEGQQLCQYYHDAAVACLGEIS